MRSKPEFEARVRELAVNKQRAQQRKRRTIRNLTIAGGVFVCAACCVIVFNKIQMNLDTIKKSGSSENFDELYDMTNTYPDCDIIPENAVDSSGSEKSEIPDETMVNNALEDGINQESYVSVMCENKFEDGTTEAVLLKGKNATKLIEWLENLETAEAFDKKTDEFAVSYEIKEWSDNYSNTVIIEANYIKIEDIWYSFSAEDEAALNEILNEYFK